MISNKSVYATLPRTQRGMPLVLGGDPKGVNFTYTNGNHVIIRNIADPNVADVYSEHSTTATVAKYSPSGFYICSADISGKIRIWDTTQKEHILKAEYQPFLGTVKDLAWSFDSQRIVVVGEGREKFGHVINMETGTSVGEIAGHSKTINSCDFRPCRPMRIVTGGEDNLVAYYEGPPFKFKGQCEEHSKYVQTVRYSPNGAVFASGGFDGKVMMYDGNTSQIKCELKSKAGPAHSGGIYAVSWSPDGTKLLSASGDRTCKLWDVETSQCVSKFDMGTDVLDQQVSCLWQGEHLLSVSLSGFINYLNINDPSKPIRVISGHNKSITSMACAGNTLYTGGYDGLVNYWNLSQSNGKRLSKDLMHKNQVQEMRVCKHKNVIYTIGFDDTLKSISLDTNDYTNLNVKLDSQPKSIATLDKLILIACYKHLLVYNEQAQQQYSVSINYEPSAASGNALTNHVAVGGYKDHKVHIYKLSPSGNKLEELEKELTHRDAITCCEYSPNGKYLAVGDANRKIVLYNTDTYEPAHNQEWGYHTAKVNCIAWSPNSQRLVSGSLDTSLIVWNVNEPQKYLHYKKAHPLSQVNKVEWLDDNTVVSCGQDSNIKFWDIK